jgi:hypothetical protein
MQAMTNNDSAASIMIALYVLIVVMFFKRINNIMLMVSIGIGALVYAFEFPMTISVAMATIAMGLFIYYEKKEGFQAQLPTIVKTVNSSFKPHIIEGYEDVKKEKDEVPAPADEKEEASPDTYEPENDTKESPLFQSKESEKLAKPFTLGEIPGQVKKGPHLDVSSTLMKAINSLDPEQVKAMSVDTKQLIETQKTLMGMLGNMKPMLQDGKELMNTFNDMFGK